MSELRALRWPDDLEALRALDTGYATDRIFQLVRTPRGFAFEERIVDGLVEKTYPIVEQAHVLAKGSWTQIATDEVGVAGLVALDYTDWNRRAQLAHVYVATGARRQGTGRRLVEAAAEHAQRLNARCLWVETQAANYGAIRFYESLGFRWCGLDTSLYDPSEVNAHEVAVFLEQAL